MKPYLTRLYGRGSSLTEIEKEVERRVSDIDLRFDDMRKQVEEITKQQVSHVIHTRVSMVDGVPYPIITFDHVTFPPADRSNGKYCNNRRLQSLES